MQSIGRLQDGSEVGAWLLKANPEVWDIAAFAATGEPIDSWRLSESYRLELMSPGDPCVLWVTGPDDGPVTPGVWAIGELTSELWVSDGEDDGLWGDEDARTQVRPRVDVDLQYLRAPLARKVLKADPRFADAEILRAPRVGNPVALTPGELATIEDHLDRDDLWPEDPELEQLLDEAEQAAVTQLVAEGWEVEERDEPPFFVATRDGVRRDVFFAPTTERDTFPVAADEHRSLRAAGEPTILVVVLLPDDEFDDPEVLTVRDEWIPGSKRWDPKTERYRI